jgi:uncharacterized membrane protein YgcG
MVLTRTVRTVAAIFAAALGGLAPAMAIAAVAAPVRADVSVPADIAVRADVSDFSFASFDAVYELSADEEGRSVLDTTETLVAEFPEIDQNRGIQRAIPLDYDGHPVDLRITSVTDGTGAARAYETDEEDDLLVLTIADDEYVHGAQTYVISYEQHNVTHVPDDADLDEFSWDVNGTGWEQPFGRVSAELRVDEAIVGRFTGSAACYQGPEGDPTRCDTIDTSTSPLVITAAAEGLGPHENLSIAAAFEPGTFTPRDDRFFSSPAAVIGGAAALVAVAMGVLALTLRLTRWRHHPGRGIIVAEYEPPAQTTVMEAAELVGHATRGVSATLLELAVRGDLRVIETAPKKYSVEAVGPGAAGAAGDADARELARLLFSAAAADKVGTGAAPRRDLASSDSALAKALYALRARVAKRVVANGWRRTPDRGLRLTLAIVGFVAGVVGFICSIVALDAAMGGVWPVLLFIAGLLGAMLAIGSVVSVRPLTEQGRALRDRLEGLREYIRLAEADRLKMLQSPTGALRSAVPEAGDGRGGVIGDPRRDDTVLRITERLLPYAVLFGLEQEWSRELAALYDARGSAPGWYDGQSGFNAVAFATGVHAFSAASTTSWSGSTSSSSSSASSGGGASGGGGGGGGGGGV